MSKASILGKIMGSKAGRLVEAGARYSVPGLLDEAMGQVFETGMKGIWGGVTGLADGLMGKGLNLTNTSLLGGALKTVGWGATTAATTIAKPIGWAAGRLIKNTPADAAHWAKVGKGIFNMGFKKTSRQGIGVLGGHEARMATPWLLTAGAVGIGAASSAKDERFNLGLRTAVNGIMDTEGVSLTPGMVNPSYTPIKGKPINNHGATGDLVGALHRGRNG